MVRAEGSRPRGRGFKSRRILDGCKRFANYYIKEKLKIKVAKWGTPKKYLKKNFINFQFTLHMLTIKDYNLIERKKDRYASIKLLLPTLHVFYFKIFTKIVFACK